MYSRVSIVLILVVVLNGCVAVWGEAHKITEASSEKFVIQYDPTLTSGSRGQLLATKHCAKYGKKVEFAASGMPGVLLGIIEDTYLCQ